jgi:RHS repeat-associated protein
MCLQRLGTNQANFHSRSTGKERDPETGFANGNDYFGSRYYVSGNGAWLSPDQPFADQHSSNPQSWKLYEYARNNPLRNVDSNGFKVIPAEYQEAIQQMTAIANAGGGRFYLDVCGYTLLQ